MASELAKRIYQLEWNQIDVIDAELQEVREIVELIAHPKFKAAESGIQYYITKSDVEAARALWAKLRLPDPPEVKE